MMLIGSLGAVTAFHLPTSDTFNPTINPAVFDKKAKAEAAAEAERKRRAKEAEVKALEEKKALEKEKSGEAAKPDNTSLYVAGLVGVGVAAAIIYALSRKG